MTRDDGLKLNPKFGYVQGMSAAAYATVAYPAMLVFFLSAISAAGQIMPGGHVIGAVAVLRDFILLLLIGIAPVLPLSVLFILVEFVQRLLHRQRGAISFLAVSISAWLLLFAVIRVGWIGD